MSISVGWTSTRYGITNKQLIEMLNWLEELANDQGEQIIVRHGDCKGGDEQLHNELISSLPDWLKHIYVHPPNKDTWRAFCTGPVDLVTVMLPLPYYVRNRSIVDLSECLCAAPRYPANSTNHKGGTWWTVEYASGLNWMPAGHIKIFYP